jgi:hypothetical protein
MNKSTGDEPDANFSSLAKKNDAVHDSADSDTAVSSLTDARLVDSIEQDKLNEQLRIDDVDDVDDVENKTPNKQKNNEASSNVVDIVIDNEKYEADEDVDVHSDDSIEKQTLSKNRNGQCKNNESMLKADSLEETDYGEEQSKQAASKNIDQQQTETVSAHA